MQRKAKPLNLFFAYTRNLEKFMEGGDEANFGAHIHSKIL